MESSNINEKDTFEKSKKDIFPKSTHDKFGTNNNIEN